MAAALLGIPNAAAQVTPGTVLQDALIGDPDSPFAGAFPYPASPIGNPFWEPNHPGFDLVQKQVALGKALFWDEQLSSDSTVACGTCHAMKAGGTDGREGAFGQNQKFGSPGMFPQDGLEEYRQEALNTPLSTSPPARPVNRMKRVTEFTAPTMINAVFFNQLFWQHRAGPSFNVQNDSTVELDDFKEFAAAESLSAFPQVNPTEMSHDKLEWDSGLIQAKLADSSILRLATPSTVPPDIQWLLGNTYEDIFEALYGPGVGGGTAVTRERVAMSIAHYMRTLISDQAPILTGALTVDQRRAFTIMRSNVCFTCHSSSTAPTPLPGGGMLDKFDALLSDGRLHSISLPPPGHQIVDENGVPGLPFVKTPSLLNLGLRNRFFHSGQIRDIDTLLSFYNDELSTSPAFVFTPQLTPLQKSWMRSLWVDGFTDPRVANAQFPFDRPDLYSERLTAIGATENLFGDATPGLLGAPLIISNPPAVGAEPWFKAGLANALPGAVAMFGLSTSVTGTTGLMLGGSIQWSSPVVVAPDRMATWQEEIDPLLGATAVIGQSFVGQWLINDASGAPGFTATSAARYLVH